MNLECTNQTDSAKHHSLRGLDSKLTLCVCVRVCVCVCAVCMCVLYVHWCVYVCVCATCVCVCLLYVCVSAVCVCVCLCCVCVCVCLCWRDLSTGVLTFAQCKASAQKTANILKLFSSVFVKALPFSLFTICTTPITVPRLTMGMHRMFLVLYPVYRSTSLWR